MRLCNINLKACLIFMSFMISISLQMPLIYPQDNQEKEQMQKQKMLIESYKIDDNAKKLKLEYSISDKDLTEKGIYFKDLLSIFIDKENNIYISEPTQNKIYIFNIEGVFVGEFGRKGQGPGEFNRPNDIFGDIDGNIYINDMGNARFNIFNKSRKYIYSFKRYKTYYSLCADSNGSIYANYKSKNIEDENLIEVLNRKGELIRSFGKRASFKGNTTSHNEVNLTIADDKYIYAVWTYFNIFRKYSLDGKLIIDTNIKNEMFENISDANNSKMIPVDGVVSGKLLFTGACYYEGKVYLLRTYPRVEIYECNDNGKIENTYWSNIPYDYVGKILRVVKIDGDIRFLTIQRNPIPSILVYSIVSN